MAQGLFPGEANVDDPGVHQLRDEGGERGGLVRPRHPRYRERSRHPVPESLPQRLGDVRVILCELLPGLAGVGAAVGAEEPRQPRQAFPGVAMKISTTGMDRPWARSMIWT